MSPNNTSSSTNSDPPWILANNKRPTKVFTKSFPSFPYNILSQSNRPIATANQFSCFNNTADDEAYADSGATIHIVTPSKALANETLTLNGPLVISATKDIIQAHSKDDLQLDNLPIKSIVAHKMPVSQNLLSLSLLADDNMVSILDKNKIHCM